LILSQPSSFIKMEKRTYLAEFMSISLTRLIQGNDKTQLKDKAGVSNNVIAKLGKNEPVAIETLVKIAIALDVDISGISGLEER
jgi:putative transcriptional regulator